jgi:hypothetical protein
MHSNKNVIEEDVEETVSHDQDDDVNMKDVVVNYVSE